jgi:hypothetical protein
MALQALGVDWMTTRSAGHGGRGRMLLISPEDKAAFLAVLHRRAPRLAS